jgi:ABC-type transporter MlaC component
VTRRLPAPLALTLFALSLFALAVPARADGHIPAVQAELAAFYERIGAIVEDDDVEPAQTQALVARELDRRLDYGYLAAAALGRQIEGFSREQFADFAHAYAQFLQDFFVGLIATSDEVKLKILDTREDAEGRVIVKAKSKPRRGVIPGSLRVARSPTSGDTVSYAFRKSSGGWRIAGISLGGIDVSTTFRGQLQAFLTKNDPDALIAELRRRNAEYQGTNPFAEDD